MQLDLKMTLFYIYFDLDFLLYMAKSQQIELKLGQALKVCSHLGKLKIGGLADKLEFEHDPKWGIHYMYDGPLGRPEESGRDGKGGTVSIISALLFIPSGSAAAVRKVLTVGAEPGA